MSAGDAARAPATTVEEAIATRRSVRAYLPDPVPEKTVRRILEVASRAPSGTNVQPWQVYVVAGAVKERVSKAVIAARERGEEEREYEYYPSSWREPYLGRRRKVGWDLYGLVGVEKGDKAGMHRQHTRNFLFFDAPVGLFFTLGRDLERGSWMDMGMFLENVMVAARGHGLHTCPQAAWVGYHKVLRELLAIPEDQAFVCGMSLGYEDRSAPENRLETVREPVDEFAKFFGF